MADDFISRKLAMEKINDIAAEFLKDHTIQCDIAAGVAVDIKNDVIKTLPAADVVEVIRCKDCKHWNDENIELHRSSNEDETSAEFAECRFFSTMRLCYMMRFDDFCSQGERRGNEAERAESNTKNNDVN